MSQYPSPYSQPPINYQGGYAPMTGDPMAPARHSSTLMTILGILVLLMGGCMSLVGLTLPSIMDKMPPEQMKLLQDVEASTHLSASTLFLGLGIFLMVVSIAYIIVGIFVRRGSLGWVIAGIVLTVVTILYLLLNAVGSLFQGAAGMGGACVSFLLLGLFGWLLILLIQATKVSGKMRQMQAQYQAQYMQYQQTMQQYGQAGYGYGYPPPPAPGAQNPPPEQSAGPGDAPK